MSARVLIITPSIKPGGGPPGYVHNLMLGVLSLDQKGALQNSFVFLGRRGHERNKATGEASGVRKRSVYNLGVALLTKAGLKPLLSPRIRDAKKQIRDSDIVIFQGFQDPYLLIYARKKGVRTIYMPHSPCPYADEYKSLCALNGAALNLHVYRRFVDEERCLMRDADMLAFPVMEAASNYRALLGGDLDSRPTVYVKSGVAVESGSADFLRREGRPRLYFAGRYVADRGYDIFCDAAEHLREEGIDADFYTIGDGPMKRASSHVVDLGWRNDVHAALMEADIIVCPNRVSYYDLLPLECAGLGKPMVMTAVGGNADQLRDLPDCVACSEPSIAQLGVAMKEAIGRFHHESSWGGANREAFARLFTVEAFARRWDDEISALHDERPQP